MMKLIDGVQYRSYKRKSVTWARPYKPGESLEGVSVSKEDTPSTGGLIAVNEKNPQDKWYIAAQYAADNLEVDQ